MLKNIRNYCKACMNGNVKEINHCTVKDCALYDLRFGNPKRLKVLKQIKMKCFDCSGYNRNEVKNCKIVNCSLYQYRNGANPKRKRNKINNLLHSFKNDSI